jgi:hypothetical protein
MIVLRQVQPETIKDHQLFTQIKNHYMGSRGNRYARLFALVAAANKQNARIEINQLVNDYTCGRITSVKDLSDTELKSLENHIQNMFPKDSHWEKKNNLRRAIIAQFKSVNKSVTEAKAWAEKYGVKGVKREFNEYSIRELAILLVNAKTMAQQYREKITKSDW